MRTLKIKSWALSLLVATVLYGSASATPRLTLPDTAFDFGYTPQNATISHKFWLISSGDDSLIILKVIPG